MIWSEEKLVGGNATSEPARQDSNGRNMIDRSRGIMSNQDSAAGDQEKKLGMLKFKQSRTVSMIKEWKHPTAALKTDPSASRKREPPVQPTNAKKRRKRKRSNRKN